jgi:hypothetical protein
MRVWAAGLAVLVGCNGTNGDATTPSDGCGTSRCDQADWPQLVVAESSLTDGGIDAAALQITAVIGGAVQQAYRGDCPNGINVIDCQYQFWRAPADTSVALRIGLAGQPPATKTIAMKAFNHCGNDLSYVHFSVDGANGDPSYVSPCRIMP